MTQGRDLEARVAPAEPGDLDAWLVLAREVEPLFGPMADEPGFCQALAGLLAGGAGLCVRKGGGPPGAPLCGAVAVSPEENEVAWVAVAEAGRGAGTGRALVLAALGLLDRSREVRVQTFAPGVPEGMPARRLYQSLGFRDLGPGGKNPAGVETVFMALAPAEPCP